MKALTPSILAIVICSTFVSAPSEASSHREAPNISRFPTLDSTDFYVFNSYEQGRGDFVTLIANYIPLQDAYGGPNYFAMDPDATYSIHIDNDGDAVEDITFAFNFKSMLPNDNQGVQLTVGPEGNQRTVSVPLKNVGGVAAGDDSAANFSESYTMSMISGAQRTGEATVLNNTASNSST
ncbi:DUF4331 family protein, partial [Pseudoalteromonas distincta]|uniref:DUF4331 family protein n=1 Tax=Pseudoalteromonas distincta TaxID=77608 RepID=UPI0039E90D40